MNDTVLVDKSFLQGASASIVAALASTHRLLMSDALFYELISSSEPGRSRCFAKLKGENPVVLVEHVGGLLKREISTSRSAGKPSSHPIAGRFEFHPELALGTFELTGENLRATQEQTEELRGDVKSFIAQAHLIPASFPNLRKGTTAQQAIARTEAESIIANDTEALLEFYGGLEAPAGFPPFPARDLLDEQWALYRWFQVKLLFAVDAYCRYGSQLDVEALTPNWYERLEHDVLDAQYLILGALEGSFATREKKLKDWWQLLRPDGELHE